MRKTLIALAAFAATGGLIWVLQSGDSDHPMQSTATRAVQVASPGSGPAEAAQPEASEVPARSRPLAAQSGSVPTGVGGSEMSSKAIAELGLTRQLAGEHLLNLDGRQQRVLGSKEVVDQSGKSETMLVIRDELSGQISYWLSGLQFTLKDNIDYVSFIGEHPAMRQLFVNPLYAQVAIDAAEIARQYAALKLDSRVVTLRLMTRAPVIKPR